MVNKGGAALLFMYRFLRRRSTLGIGFGAGARYALDAGVLGARVSSLEERVLDNVRRLESTEAKVDKLSEEANRSFRALLSELAVLKERTERVSNACQGGS